MSHDFAPHIHEPALSLHFNMYAPGISWDEAAGNHRSNCYAYALNLPESQWAIPGSVNQNVKRYRDEDMEPRALQKLLGQDGLQPITAVEARNGQVHAIACVLRLYEHFHEDADFHFMRLDHATGLWSHKNGTAHPEDIDDSRRLITDPEKTRFIGYEAFCGYFAIPEDGIPYVSRDMKKKSYMDDPLWACLRGHQL